MLTSILENGKNGFHREGERTNNINYTSGANISCITKFISNFNKPFSKSRAQAQAPLRGQGTMEYLVIIGIVVVLSLVTVGVVVGIMDSSSGVSLQQNKLFWQSQPVGVSEAGADSNGNSFFVVTNNTGETIILTGYHVGATVKDFDTSGTLPSISAGEKKVVFIVGQTPCDGSTCAFDNFAFTYKSATGLDKVSTPNSLVVEKQDRINRLSFAGSALVCVNNADVGFCSSQGGVNTDTNWQTSWNVFDANMKSNYLSLNQTIGQTISNGMPFFQGGLRGDIYDNQANPEKSIDSNNRQLISSSGGAVVDWGTDAIKLTPNNSIPSLNVYSEFGVGSSFNNGFMTVNEDWNDGDNVWQHQIAIGTNNDAGFPVLTSYQSDDIDAIGIAPNALGGGYIGNALVVEDLGQDELGNTLGMTIYSYENNSQVKAPLQVIIQSPDGTNYRITVDDSGNLSATPI